MRRKRLLDATQPVEVHRFVAEALRKVRGERGVVRSRGVQSLKGQGRVMGSLQRLLGISHVGKDASHVALHDRRFEGECRVVLPLRQKAFVIGKRLFEQIRAEGLQPLRLE